MSADHLANKNSPARLVRRILQPEGIRCFFMVVWCAVKVAALQIHQSPIRYIYLGRHQQQPRKANEDISQKFTKIHFNCTFHKIVPVEEQSSGNRKKWFLVISWWVYCTTSSTQIRQSPTLSIYLSNNSNNFFQPLKNLLKSCLQRIHSPWFWWFFNYVQREAVASSSSSSRLIHQSPIQYIYRWVPISDNIINNNLARVFNSRRRSQKQLTNTPTMQSSHPASQGSTGSSLPWTNEATTWGSVSGTRGFWCRSHWPNEMKME